MTHEQARNIIIDFGRTSTSMCEFFESHVELEAEDNLFIENNFVALQMAYAKWKRGRVGMRKKAIQRGR